MKFDNGQIHVELTFGGVIKGVILGAMVTYFAKKIIDYRAEVHEDMVRETVRDEMRKNGRVSYSRCYRDKD